MHFFGIIKLGATDCALQKKFISDLVLPHGTINIVRSITCGNCYILFGACACMLASSCCL